MTDERQQQAARDHLWLHFSRHSVYEQGEMPVIVRGEGAYLYDAKGKRYLDGLAGLFVNQLGHGRTDIAEAAAKQAAQLALDANVKLLALTHLSTRYFPREIRDEARAVFARTVVPRDFDAIEVPFPERGEPVLVKGEKEPAPA